MSLKRKGWIMVVFLTAWLAVGCGTDTNNPLKPPSVYKDPLVRVTHASTDAAADLVATEASASATPDLAVSQPQVEPTADDEQFLMDEIERLLNKIEDKLDKLDRMDVNP